MLEIMFVTLAAVSTLVLLVFLCTRDKYQIHKNAIKSGSLNEIPINNYITESRKCSDKKLIPSQTPPKLNHSPETRHKSGDIEKGLSNNQQSYSPQPEEFVKDSSTPFLRSFPPNTPSPRSSTETQRESVMLADPAIPSKGTHREMALPPPPHLERIKSLDQGLSRSQSEVQNNNISAASRAYSNVNISPEHPLEISTNKRSLIPLPDTPKDFPNTSSKPRQSVPTIMPGVVLKRGKSQSELEIPTGDMDLGYEALTLDRNFNKKRYPNEIMLDAELQGSYPRPSYYAQLKKNSVHGSLNNVTPPNSAFSSKSSAFDFSPKNTKRRRTNSTSIGSDYSPFHPPMQPGQAESSPTSTTKPNPYAKELKPILNRIIKEINKQIDEDPSTDINAPKERHASSDMSDVHENSIYNLNELMSSLSSPERETSVKKRHTTISTSSSDDNSSIHENSLYASIEDDLEENAVKNEALNIHSISPNLEKILVGHNSSNSDNNSSLCYSELERSDSGKQNYDSLTLMRVEDSDESNATSSCTKSSHESNYGKFLQKPIAGYDTLEHFPTTKWKSTSDLDGSSCGSSPPNLPNHDAHHYTCLTEGDEEETNNTSFSKRTRSVHDYEKINEDELIILTPRHKPREIGPF